MRSTIAKDAATRCPAILNFTRQQRCFHCGAAGPSDAHHYPPKGMGGRHIDDTRVLPACRTCHTRCAGISVVIDGVHYEAIPKEAQLIGTLENLRAFIDQAGAEDIESLRNALLERERRRIFGSSSF